jgi:hypothetical protein
MQSLPNYFTGRLTDLGVDVRTGTTADEAMILALAPDVVVVATGSSYRTDGLSGFVPKPIPGADRSTVVPADGVLDGSVRVSGKVLILDDEGYHTGAGLAEVAAAAGQAVYVTRHFTTAAYIPIFTGAATSRMRSAGVDIQTGTYVREIKDGSVVLFDIMTGEERELDGIDHVILVTARQPVDELSEALEGKVPYVYLIGDALAPRSLRAAIYEGHRYGRVIGEDQMPASVLEDQFEIDRNGPRIATDEPVAASA